MNISFDWLIKFFGYSSIQVKIIATIVAIVSFVLIRKVIIAFLISKIKDVKERYNWQKITGYSSFVLAIFVVGQIWFDGVQSIVTYLGLVSAGIAIALKDPIANVGGWMFILWRSPLEVGDRIQLGEHSGDVIDINIFKFTIMEIGNWVEADQSTGRIIHIPNSQVFNQSLANYGKGFEYIWNEIPVLITFESDWKMCKEFLKETIDKHAAHLKKSAAEKVKKASKKFMIFEPNLSPEVYTNVKDSGVNLTIRYLCLPNNRRNSEELIWEDILKEFDKNPKLDFAYPTIRRI